MGLTLKPLLRCNLSCVGCYEASILNHSNQRPDIEAMLATSAKSSDDHATLHGGEVLLLNRDEAEKLCDGLHQQSKTIGMQTNASMITESWWALIEKYRITVGVSLNGPGDLNRARWAGSEAATDRMTERIHRNCAKLAKMGRLGGIITVLSTHNAGDDEKLERLIRWATEVVRGEWGCTSIRFNPLFGEGELSPERLEFVFRRLLAATVNDPERAWLPFREWIDNLLGLGLAPCWMKPCDPYHTDAVDAVFGDGSRGNCLRTSPDGTPWQRTDERFTIRQEILFQIDMADGGCGDCRYFNFCHGGCPAEGIDGDWRNKTRWCSTILATYGEIEHRLKGLLPNILLAPDWDGKTSHEPVAIARSVEDRNPLINAFGSMSARESLEPSAYARSTRPIAND